MEYIELQTIHKGIPILSITLCIAYYNEKNT